MNRRSLTVLGLVALAILGASIGYLSRSQAPAPRPLSPASEPGLALPAPAFSATPPPENSPAPSPAAPPGSRLGEVLERVLALLERRGAKAGDLAELRQLFLEAQPEEAIAALRAFLRSGRDAATREEFAIGAGGSLTGAPTLRVLALDLLGQVARKARASAAAEISREVLATKASADEWAVALRNVAWAEPQSRSFLTARVRELLAHEPWRASPSAGLLEALDVVVFTRDASLIPDLEAARTAGSELAHATDIALDRLAEAAPLDVLTWLNAHPRTLADRPFLRADYFAKADLNIGPQRAQLEFYLGRSDITAAEKGKLLKSLATPASFVGDTLLGTTPPVDDGAARREGLSRALDEWVRADRFPLLRSELLDLRSRLTP